MSPPTELAPLPPPKVRNLCWRVIQFFVSGFFFVWLGYRARGCERLDESEGGLILANHQSFLDPLLIG